MRGQNETAHQSGEQVEREGPRALRVAATVAPAVALLLWGDPTFAVGAGAGLLYRLRNRKK